MKKSDEGKNGIAEICICANTVLGLVFFIIGMISNNKLCCYEAVSMMNLCIIPYLIAKYRQNRRKQSLILIISFFVLVISNFALFIMSL